MAIALGLFFTFFTAALVIYGDFLLKIAADKDQAIMSPLVFAGCALYAGSAIAWFFALQHVTLSQAGVAYSMLTLLALCVLGVLYFGETLYLREYAGIACAILAMILMMRIA